MDLGFETIGNATLICHDRGPVLVTDPWIQGTAYFGSWALSHEIPEAQRAAILECRFVWFSHGHPDHLNGDCLPLFRDKTILLADHFGGRIEKYLTGEGYQVRVLKDKERVRLSDRIEVMCLTEPIQDSILLVFLDGHLIVNKNDSPDTGWTRFIKSLVKTSRSSFLLALSGYGDVDMINFYDEQGNFILPAAAKRAPIGPSVELSLSIYGIDWFVPFSAMHQYVRVDSLFANAYSTPIDDHARGASTNKILPPFIRYDLTNATFQKISPAAARPRITAPEENGDHWNDLLERDDYQLAEKYFGAVESLRKHLDYINLRVGKKDNIISLGKGTNRGITFEAPRQSLMTAIQYEIFDDILIGNFMKTTLHGKWPRVDLAPYFTPALPKYADNGLAKTRKEVAAYLAEYDHRCPDRRLKLVEDKVVSVGRALFDRDSLQYRLARGVFRGLRKVSGR